MDCISYRDIQLNNLPLELIGDCKEFDKLSQNKKRFIALLFVSKMMAGNNDSFYLYIPANEVRRIVKGKYYSNEVKALRNAEYIKIKEYNVGKNPYGFKLTEKSTNAIFNQIGERKDYYKWWVIKKAGKLKTCFDINEAGEKKYYSPFIRNTLKHLKYLQINQKRLKELEEYNFNQIKSKNRSKQDERHYAHLGYIRCFTETQKVKNSDNLFHSNYYSKKTRIFGNLQSIPSVIRKEIFDGYFNYDLSNSQLNILKNFCDRAGINSTAIDEYKVIDKNERAKKIAISTGCFKDSVFCVQFGGKLKPSHFNKDGYRTTSKSMKDIFKPEYKKQNPQLELIEDWKPDSDFYNWMDKKTILIKRELKNIIPLFNEWIDYLKCDYQSFFTHNKLIINACGNTFSYKNYVEKKGNKVVLSNEGVRKLSAFLLQGMETRIIGELIELLSKEGITIIHYEFDGIVVDKRFDEEKLIAKVMEKLNLEHIIINEKSFTDKNYFNYE
jgi:hypothetical protein